MGEEVNAAMSTMNDGPAYEPPAEPMDYAGESGGGGGRPQA